MITDQVSRSHASDGLRGCISERNDEISSKAKSQVEVTSHMGPLLDPSTGELPPSHEGWARYPNFWTYDRRSAQLALQRSSKALNGFYHRHCRTLKEWDYYALISHEQCFGICITLADLGGVASLASVVFLDFDRGFSSQVDSVRLPWVPYIPVLNNTGAQSISLANQSFSGNVGIHDSQLQLAVDWDSLDGQGILSFAAPNIKNAEGEKGLVGRVVLRRPRKGEDESLTIATSWGPSLRSYYYFNQKANCLEIQSGGFSIGKQQYSFHLQKDLAVLDWGRGVWTHKNRWFWSSLSCSLKDGRGEYVNFGWNLGYGFSDRSRATENCIFYAGRVHKLGEIEFLFDSNDYLKPWRIQSTDDVEEVGKPNYPKRFTVEMVPIIDRNFSLNLGLVKSIQHQVFGRFTGYCRLDDGREIRIDQVLGFAEDVLNWW